MKKKFFKSLLSAVLVIFVCTWLSGAIIILPTGGVYAEETVFFKDRNLAAAVRRAIGKPSAGILKTDLQYLYYLHASGRNITDLTGLESCTSLQYLYLFSNQITDISPLQNLTNLHYINISNNQITDISALQNLTRLEALWLDNNQINDISALLANQGLGMGDMIGFTYNFLNSTPGSPTMNDMQIFINRGASVQYRPQKVDFPDDKLEKVIRKAISKPAGDILENDLTSLYDLDCASSRITDLTGLEHCINLQKLYLDYNRIINVTALQNLTKLRRLNLRNNKISDINPLQNLTRLQYINLNQNQINDISGLVNNPGIGSGDLVYLRSNYLDITPGCPGMNDIQSLIDRGVTVYYEPQNSSETVQVP